jgi:hypothetical protein
MEVITTKNQLSRAQLLKKAQELFGNMVKAVVDVEEELMAIGGELHADEEALLLQQGSKQKNLWGINLYPELTSDWIEFDSMINLRPSEQNRSRGVEDFGLRTKIIEIVNKLVKNGPTT